MAKVFPIIVALGLTVAFAAPAVAGTGPNTVPPTTQRMCDKAKMKWDVQNQKCCSSQTASGRCM
jgi:hypothetical protein